ncbi:phenylacetate--CoA ligase family protein [Deefgea salmonis]|uniref:Uncharacterized protein n=1 Tax=Deefgea salmonis TaxID=2875502 RepID=A0ABS8BIQ6_9NEIS|nr:hypothetical protein [Deefgea salmonis]MCB5195594.1 hypothetical protein [Deefgea salmonis]
MHVKKELKYFFRYLVRDGFIADFVLRKVLGSQPTVKSSSDYQFKMLNKSLVRAVETLPAYTQVDLKEGNHGSLADLISKFQIVTKADLLEKPTMYYPYQAKPKRWHSVGKSSGTTGSPLVIFRDLYSVLIENYFVKRHWQECGFVLGQRCASLRGDHIVELNSSTPPFWFFNRYNNQLLISSRHLVAACIDAIINELRDFSPQMLQAYPSTAFTLAKYLEEKNQYLSIPIIFTSSEPLYLHQRALIESRLQGKSYDMYGMAERVAFVTECEHGEMHVNSEYSLVEIVDDNDIATDDYGYVVGTTFHNKAMPLIRYKLSDRTKWKKIACQCGSVFPVVEPIVGKYEDQIFGGSGAPISPSVLTFAFKGVKNILKSQVAQITSAIWEVRIVPDCRYSDVDGQLLIRNIAELVDAHIIINIILRDDLPNTLSGKFRWVVNEMKN